MAGPSTPTIPAGRWLARACALACLSACALLSACGQKGPLYLPGPAQSASDPSSSSSK
ncbi:MAG: hypothetical protein EKK47_00780 [Burkholderiales bacterium]|nr:MAG: hypothetical protein EKK47_00780 [Burkholderiales bacterium]